MNKVEGNEDGADIFWWLRRLGGRVWAENPWGSGET